jgi:uncharacterized protein YbjQ (UPF0145 family)
MIITTTPTVEGHPIEEYLGIVAGEAILGAHIGRDILASLTDIVGGRSAEYEGEVRKARSIATREMAAEAERKGGNAIVGVDIDYEVIRQGMLMVSVSGTAVKVRWISPKLISTLRAVAFSFEHRIDLHRLFMILRFAYGPVFGVNYKRVSMPTTR